MESKIKVYVASPYTKGDVAINVKTGLDMGDKLMSMGYSPYCPLVSHFQHMLNPRPYQDWLDHDFQWIPACDVLLRLPGDSSGADKEVALAKSLNIPVFYSVEELEIYKGSQCKSLK